VPPSAPSALSATLRRPLLKPALRRLWRDPATVQLGLTPPRAVLVSGLGTLGPELLALLDGTRDSAALDAAAAELGLAPGEILALVDRLAAAGALDDAAVRPATRGEHERQRLEPDRRSLSLRHPAPGAADALLRRRRRRSVTVHGAGRLGGTVATLLAAAGVGRGGRGGPGGQRGAGHSPAGVSEMQGGPRGDAAAARVAAVAVGGTASAEADPDADLAVVAPAAPAPLPEVLAAVRRRPHLLVSVRETVAAIGPFVLPGRTPCLRCLELGRGDRDPRWPSLAAQLAASTRAVVDPCELPLATAAGSIAVMHALHWLDTGDLPSSAGGVVEVDAADGATRRRSLAAHPACGCGAAG
jgi:bacteriocin biosynthesis cyclodehydratase domain-containing protein